MMLSTQNSECSTLPRLTAGLSHDEQTLPHVQDPPKDLEGKKPPRTQSDMKNLIGKELPHDVWFSALSPSLTNSSHRQLRNEDVLTKPDLGENGSNNSVNFVADNRNSQVIENNSSHVRTKNINQPTTNNHHVTRRSAETHQAHCCKT